MAGYDNYHTDTASRADRELRRSIDEAFADTRPSIPARDVFARLRLRHAERVKAEQKKSETDLP